MSELHVKLPGNIEDAIFTQQIFNTLMKACKESAFWVAFSNYTQAQLHLVFLDKRGNRDHLGIIFIIFPLNTYIVTHH